MNTFATSGGTHTYKYGLPIIFSKTYLVFTLLYVAIGLALTTIAIEIAADYLKKLHYFGRKMENVGNVAIWFGGKKYNLYGSLGSNSYVCTGGGQRGNS
jgi:hypothetical protein